MRSEYPRLAALHHWAKGQGWGIRFVITMALHFKNEKYNSKSESRIAEHVGCRGEEVSCAVPHTLEELVPTVSCRVSRCDRKWGQFSCDRHCPPPPPPGRCTTSAKCWTFSISSALRIIPKMAINTTNYKQCRSQLFICFTRTTLNQVSWTVQCSWQWMFNMNAEQTMLRCGIVPKYSITKTPYT